jgi:large subunit ribosomal protein L18
MTTKKVERRIKIKYRIRKSVFGTAERPRMSVFRSNKQIYVQVINDLTGKTLASASSLGLESMPKDTAAEKVGELVAQKAQKLESLQLSSTVMVIFIMVELKNLLMQHVKVDLNFKRLWQ